MSSEDTVLIIDGAGLPRFSARGVEQTLSPIGDATSLRRTVNGKLVSVADPLFRKYESTITCQDQRVPAFQWPGTVVEVHCVQEISEELATDQGVTEITEITEAALTRTPVPESIRVEDGFVFYRPILTMVVVSFRTQTDEWNATVGWSISLEEQ